MSALIDELPLFAAQLRRPEPETDDAAATDPLREALSGLDIDDMTPRAALDALYRLKGLA